MTILAAAITLAVGLFTDVVAEGISSIKSVQNRIWAVALVVALLTMVLVILYLLVANTRLRTRQSAVEEQSTKMSVELDELKRELETNKDSETRRLARIGIVAVAETLKDSEWDPTRIMQRASSGLEFMGCFGHKWVSNDDHIGEFRRMVARIRMNGGTVKFLLVNPDSKDALEIANVRRQELSGEYAGFPSIGVYQALARELPAFELRFSTEFLQLRVLRVDDKCVVSSYLVTGDPRDELDAPQVVVSRIPEPNCWTLYTPMRELFEHHWNKSTPVS
ncbi:MAG TPA: hypothetical protein VGB92_00085 [Longimicrobium sp.]